MLRYIDTFYQRRFLFLLPVAVAVSLALGLGMSQPVQYQATERIWVEARVSVPVPADINPNQYVSPAAQQQQVLSQLVKTESFAVRVARSSGLSAYVRTPSGYRDASGVIGGTTHELRRLLGKGRPLTDAEADGVAGGLIGARVQVAADGPQMVVIAMQLADPALAAHTTTLLVASYGRFVTESQQTQAQAAVDFYRKQVTEQQPRLRASTAAVDAYLAQNPGQASATTIPTVTLKGLQDAQSLDAQRLQTLQGKLDQANLQLAGSQSAGATGFRVLDAARADEGPANLTRQWLLSVAGGLSAGLVVALAMVGGLTWSDSSLRRVREVYAELGMRPIGSVPFLAQKGRV